MKTEAVITAELMKQNRIPVGCWEVKRTTDKSLAFDEFAGHQIDSLMKAYYKKLNIKIRDIGRHKKPFDGATFLWSPAWCICCYPAENKDGYNAYAINIDAWYNARRTCGRKSLSEKLASEIGHII